MRLTERARYRRHGHTELARHVLDGGGSARRLRFGTRPFHAAEITRPAALRLPESTVNTRLHRVFRTARRYFVPAPCSCASFTDSARSRRGFHASAVTFGPS